MKNNLNDIIKERLENRLEWRNYLGWLLTHRELQMSARRKFYEDKPLLNVILKLYFLPFNTLKSLIPFFLKINISGISGPIIKTFLFFKFSLFKI